MLDRIYKKPIPKSRPAQPKIMLRNNTNYTLTINFNDECQHFDTPDRMAKIYKDYRKILKLLQKVASFELYFEFSTPDAYKCHNKMGYHSGPRFHIHGIISFHNVIKYYLNTYTQLLNYALFEIDTISDEVNQKTGLTGHQTWDLYIQKDREVMQPYIQSLNYKHMLYPTIYTHTELVQS